MTTPSTSAQGPEQYYPHRVWIDRDEDGGIKRWYSVKGMGVEYVRADVASPSPASDASPSGVDAGWKLVPVEPNKDMVARALDLTALVRDAGFDAPHLAAIYRAMLAAAPASPAAGGVDAVAVKPLEWHRVTYGWLAFGERYRIEDQGPNWPTERYWLSDQGERLGKFNTFEQADKAMFARHEQRIRSALSPAPTSGGEDEFTYSSKQATKCACCGEHKHTPLRRDEMGGYVCLTCIDKRLRALAKPASEPAGGDDETAVESAAIRIIRNRASDGPSADRAVTHARQFDTHVWRDAKRDARAALSSSAAPAGEAGFAYRDENGGIAYQDAHPAPATVEELVRLRASLAECAHYIISPLRLSDDREEAARRADIYARAVAALSATATEGRKS